VGNVKLRLISGGALEHSVNTVPASASVARGAPGAATLVPLVYAWINGRVRRREITAGTARRYRTVALTFAETFGARPVKNMSRRDVERWLESRQHLAKGTLRNDVNTLRGFLTWLQREQHIARHPMLDIRTPKVPRSVPRALTDDEAHRFWDSLPDLRSRAIVTLMLGLGLRRAEVLGLQVGDWDRRSQTITVTGKGGHMRQLPMLESQAAHIDRYLDSIGVTAGPMIRTEDGSRSISNCWLGMLVAQWMRDAGVKHRPLDGKAAHALRHTAASDIADVETDLRVVQQFLGHQSLATTQIYLRRIGLVRIREAMEARREAFVAGPTAIAAAS
jgi:site-specific recombinase XerC